MTERSKTTMLRCYYRSVYPKPDRIFRKQYKDTDKLAITIVIVAVLRLKSTLELSPCLPSLEVPLPKQMNHFGLHSSFKANDSNVGNFLEE